MPGDYALDSAIPGLGDQPDIAPAAQQPREREPRRTPNGNSSNGSERQRPERLWDVTLVNNDTASEKDRASEKLPDAPASVTRREADMPPAAVAKPEAASVAAEIPVAVEAAPVRRRHEQDSSEARIERVVVRPDQAATPEDDAVVQPQRKGWWQRTFSGE